MPTGVSRRPPSRLQRQVAAFSPALVVLILGCIIFVNVKKARDSRTDTSRGTRILIVANRLQTHLLDAETGRRGYVITGKHRYVAPYTQAIDSAQHSYDALRVLLGQSPRYRRIARALDSLVPAKLANLRKEIDLSRSGDWAEMPSTTETDDQNQQTAAIRNIITTIRETEQRMVDTREQYEDRWERQALIVAGVGTALAFVMALVANMFLARYAETQTRAATESAKRSRRATQVALAQTSARRAAEAAVQEFQRIFSQTPVAISVMRGPEHILEIANEPFLNIMGRNQEVIGKPIREAFPELIGQEYFQILDAIYQTGEPYIIREGKAIASVSDKPWATDVFNSVCQPLINDAHEVYGIATVAYNVTELVTARNDLEAANIALQDSASKLEEQTAELEQQVEESHALQEERDKALLIAQEAQRNAEGANLAKTQFLATMSHELRTPLNAVNGYVELMLLGIPGELTVQQKDFLNRIARSGRYLLSLINDILNYAKLDAGHVEFHIEKISVDAALRSIEPMVALQIATSGLKYEYHAGDPNLMMYADPERVRQIVLNLVSNAIKFTPRGGSVVLSSGGDKKHACIYVSDTGSGISADKIASIFDPFVQGDRKLTSLGKQQGVGLGLAISRDLARQMNGELSVVSEVNVGSRFTLSLPRAQ